MLVKYKKLQKIRKLLSITCSSFDLNNHFFSSKIVAYSVKIFFSLTLFLIKKQIRASMTSGTRQGHSSAHYTGDETIKEILCAPIIMSGTKQASIINESNCLSGPRSVFIITLNPSYITNFSKTIRFSMFIVLWIQIEWIQININEARLVLSLIIFFHSVPPP